MPAILESVREKSAEIFDNICTHPFVVKIHSGELTPDAFDYYSEQDDLYLEAWCKIIHALIERLRKHSLIEDPIVVADLDFIEKHLHTVQEMIEGGVFNPKRRCSDFVPVEKSPLLCDYLQHLALCAAEDSPSITVGLAALFGCYDLYREIGCYSKTQDIPESHPYYVWLTANYEAEFVSTAERIFALTERIAQYELTTGILKNLDGVIEAADSSYHYEWQFFLEAVAECHAALSRGYT